MPSSKVRNSWQGCQLCSKVCHINTRVFGQSSSLVYKFENRPKRYAKLELTGTLFKLCEDCNDFETEILDTPADHIPEVTDQYDLERISKHKKEWMYQDSYAYLQSFWPMIRVKRGNKDTRQTIIFQNDFEQELSQHGCVDFGFVKDEYRFASLRWFPLNSDDQGKLDIYAWDLNDSGDDFVCKQSGMLRIRVGVWQTDVDFNDNNNNNSDDHSIVTQSGSSSETTTTMNTIVMMIKEVALPLSVINQQWSLEEKIMHVSVEWLDDSGNPDPSEQIDSHLTVNHLPSPIEVYLFDASGPRTDGNYSVPSCVWYCGLPIFFRLDRDINGQISLTMLKELNLLFGVRRVVAKVQALPNNVDVIVKSEEESLIKKEEADSTSDITMAASSDQSKSCLSSSFPIRESEVCVFPDSNGNSSQPIKDLFEPDVIQTSESSSNSNSDSDSKSESDSVLIQGRKLDELYYLKLTILYVETVDYSTLVNANSEVSKRISYLKMPRDGDKALHHACFVFEEQQLCDLSIPINLGQNDQRDWEYAFKPDESLKVVPFVIRWKVSYHRGTKTIRNASLRLGFEGSRLKKTRKDGCLLSSLVFTISLLYHQREIVCRSFEFVGSKWEMQVADELVFIPVIQEHLEENHSESSNGDDDSKSLLQSSKELPLVVRFCHVSEFWSATRNSRISESDSSHHSSAKQHRKKTTHNSSRSSSSSGGSCIKKTSKKKSSKKKKKRNYSASKQSDYYYYDGDCDESRVKLEEDDGVNHSSDLVMSNTVDPYHLMNVSMKAETTPEWCDLKMIQSTGFSSFMREMEQSEQMKQEWNELKTWLKRQCDEHGFEDLHKNLEVFRANGFINLASLRLLNDDYIRDIFVTRKLQVTVCRIRDSALAQWDQTKGSK